MKFFETFKEEREMDPFFSDFCTNSFIFAGVKPI